MLWMYHLSCLWYMQLSTHPPVYCLMVSDRYKVYHFLGCSVGPLLLCYVWIFSQRPFLLRAYSVTCQSRMVRENCFVRMQSGKITILYTLSSAEWWFRTGICRINLHSAIRLVPSTLSESPTLQGSGDDMLLTESFFEGGVEGSDWEYRCLRGPPD